MGSSLGGIQGQRTKNMEGSKVLHGGGTRGRQSTGSNHLRAKGWRERGVTVQQPVGKERGGTRKPGTNGVPKKGERSRT